MGSIQRQMMSWKELITNVHGFRTKQRSERGDDNDMQNRKVNAQGTGNANSRYDIAEKENLSNDDYINILKDEIQRLQARNVKASMSTIGMTCESPMLKPRSSSERGR